MKKIKVFLSLVLSLVTISLSAQNVTVKGTVSDASGQPLPGAAVAVQGTTQGVVTDVDGAYSITVPSNAVLSVSFFGYLGVSTEVAGRTRIDFVLNEDATNLDEVIVVAYGTATKSSFTGSAAVVQAEDIEKRQVSNLTNALSGAVAGVQTISSNGQPGTSSTVRIRGFGSINAGMSPLYVVDGVPYDGDIASINTQDIASMTVLKDAAAAALYGARGANGVILITTKKGSSRGDAKVNFEARLGVNSRAVKNYDVMTSTNQYMEKLYESNYNAGIYNLGYGAANAAVYASGKAASVTGYPIYTYTGSLFTADGKISPAATLGYSDGVNYLTPDDWAANTFSNNLRQEYNVSVSGGVDKLSVYASAGFLEDSGVITGSGFNRASTRLSADYQAKPWLKVGANISYSYSQSRYPGEQTNSSSSGNAFFIANNIAPVYPMFVRDAEGKIMYNGKTPVYDYGDSKSTGYTRNWMSISNPQGDLAYQTEEYLADVFNAKWYVNVNPIDGLTLSANVGLMIDSERYHMASSPLYGQSASYHGEAVQGNDRYRGITEQFLANYSKSFGPHTIDALVGYEAYSLRTESAEAYGQNLYKPGDWAVNNTIDQRRGYGSAGEYSTIGILSRVNYDYDSKYFASVSFRRDASSRFAPDHRWGNFWSIGGAWNVAKEEFFDSIDWMDMLKFKASFGQQGNDNIGNNYAYLDQYSVTGADGVFSDGNLSYKGNPDITWETSNATNAGIDFGVFHGALSGSVEYFSRQTSDMLYYKPVAASNGYSSIPMNIGSMCNSGVELDLTGVVMNTKNVQWTVFGNATFLQNKIISLHPDLEGELIDGSRIYREGESMYQFYFVKYAGVDPASGKALYWAMDDDKKEYPTADYTVARSTNRQGTGNLLPKVSGGFGTSLDFYGFDLSVQFAYQLGGRIFDSGYQSLMHNGGPSDAGSNWHVDILNSWTPENPYSNIPRVDANDTYTNSTSDRFLISSNYLSVNNVTFGYTLPSSLTKNFGIEAARVYFSGDNLAVLSARKGLDPRQSFTAATTSTYTAIRTISGGIKLTF